MSQKNYLSLNHEITSQQTFQRCFSDVVKLIWQHDPVQRQINVETTLCMSTLKFSTLNNVESTLFISTLILNVVIFNVEIYNIVSTLIKIWSFAKYDHLQKAKKSQNIFFWALKKKQKKLNTLNSKFRLPFENLVDCIPHFKRNMERNISEVAKVFITARKCSITGTIFKPFHFIKCSLSFN